jgi:hypothetical protein
MSNFQNFVSFIKHLILYLSIMGLNEKNRCSVCFLVNKIIAFEFCPTVKIPYLCGK